MSEEEEIKASVFIMNYAVCQYCKAVGIEDSEKVMREVTYAAQGQLEQEKEIKKLSSRIAADGGPIPASKFIELMNSWNWNLNESEIARELGDKYEFDASADYWESYGKLFELYFARTENQTKEYRNLWEVIGNIISEFCSNALYL